MSEEDNVYRFHKDDIQQDDLSSAGSSAAGENQNTGSQGYQNQGDQSQGTGNQGYDNYGSQGQGCQSQGTGSQGYQNQGNPGQGYQSQGDQGQSSQNQGSQGQNFQSQGMNGQPFQTGKKKDKKPKRQHHGMGPKGKKTWKFIGKVVAAALLFGLVSSLTFGGVTGLIGGGKKGQVETEEESSGGHTAVLKTVSGDSSSGSKDDSGSSGVTAIDVSSVVDNVMPSIVSINSVFESTNNFFNTSGEYTGAGSGILVAQTDDTLYVATNNHVVENASSISVTFHDGSEVDAQIKGTDADNDLAVLSVAVKDVSSDTLSGLKIATLGDSDNLKVGETAIAIGNALGYGQSVTTGVISALNRKIETEDGTSQTLIQTDAAINPGNSGGALLNKDGQVIGINSSKFSDTSVEGMGYAIPINTAIPIIQELIDRESVASADASYLGISGVDVTSDVSQYYGLPEGVYVSDVVSGSPAEDAGIQSGDVLTAFDGHSIDSMSTLKDLMQYYAAGTKVKVTIERPQQSGEKTEYKEKTVTVTLAKKSAYAF